MISNSTPHEDVYSHEQVKIWSIASMVFALAVMLFLVYLILAFCYHAYKHKSMEGYKDALRNIKATKKRKNEKMIIVNLFMLLSAIFTLLYVTLTLPAVMESMNSFCVAYGAFKMTTFGISIGSIYIALWCKVYIAFYANVWMQESISAMSRIVNMCSLMFLVLCLIVNLSLFYTSPPYESTPIGCSEVRSEKDTMFKWLFLVICVATFQVTLLYSFIYPLHMHRKHMLNIGFHSKSVIPVVKRAAVVAAVCIISDFGDACFIIFYKHPIMYQKNIVLCSNLMINLLGVMFSFVDWKEKLMPFPCLCSMISCVNKPTAHAEQ